MNREGNRTDNISSCVIWRLQPRSGGREAEGRKETPVAISICLAWNGRETRVVVTHMVNT
jgi:hypothetical protein